MPTRVNYHHYVLVGTQNWHVSRRFHFPDQLSFQTTLGAGLHEQLQHGDPAHGKVATNSYFHKISEEASSAIPQHAPIAILVSLPPTSRKTKALEYRLSLWILSHWISCNEKKEKERNKSTTKVLIISSEQNWWNLRSQLIRIDMVFRWHWTTLAYVS